MQGCNSFNRNRPLNPTTLALDSSPNSKNTILPLKLFQHPRVFIQPFPKTIQIPLSLSLSLSLSLPSQVSVSQFSPIDDTSTLANRAHPPVANGPHLVGKLQAFRYSLYPSLPHSFSLISSVLQGRLHTLCLYLCCTTRFQSPSQPLATAMTASLKYSHIHGF